jgi:hypothetical protein
MTTEHGSDGSGGIGHEQYGIARREVGDFAFVLLDHLALVSKEMPFAPGDTPRWDDDDRQAFADLMDFEASVQGLEDEIQGDFDSTFPNVSRFHAALPFSDEDRRWIVDERNMVWELESEDLARIEGSFPFEARIITLGLRQGVDRTDLVRRWAAWRRDADEFADQGKLEIACEALALIGRELLPGGPQQY